MNGSGYRFQSFRYAPILSLEPIREANASIILDFAAALRKREKGLPVLDEARAADLAARLPELDPKERPLFAMFLADAWLHDPDGTMQSKPTDIFDDLANREERLVASRVEGLMGREDRGLTEACLGLWRAATVLGSNSWDVSLERLRSFYPNWWMVLERRAEACGDPYGAENLLYRLGLSDGSRFPALRPDLLGEYFILRWLLCPKAPQIAMKSVEPFYLGVLREFRVTTAFFHRLFFDWHVRISWAEQSGGEPWSSLLPELKLDPDRAFAYCVILSDAFNWQGAAAVRRDTAARMERLAAKQPSGSPQRASACNRLGLDYLALGELPRATRYLEENCRFSEVFLGPEHPNTAASYNNLAAVYRDMGEYQKALEFCEKALRIVESVLGPEHPNTAASYNNLATVYLDMGEYQKALEYNEKALKIRESVLGPEHPDTATSYNNLATVYRDMGEYQKALESYEKALRILESVLGPEHPNTATTKRNLAALRRAMGDMQKGQEQKEPDEALPEIVLGPEHPDAARIFPCLTALFRELGKPEKQPNGDPDSPVGGE